MHKIIKLLKGKQNGQVLVLALALLGVGSLMIAPMLSFMGTGLNAGVVAEDKTDQLYACDAGVQDAIWNINHLDEPGAIPYEYLDGLDGVGNPITETYDYADPVIGRPLPHVNGMDVYVSITLLYPLDGFGVYRVQTWVGSDSYVDADTSIDAIITTVWLDYGNLLDNAITSPGTVTLQPGSDVVGGVVSPEEPGGSGGYDVWTEDDVALWPTADQLIAWYMLDVAGLTPEPLDTIDIKDDVPEPAPPNQDERYLWPIYSEVDLLDIGSSEADLTLFLGAPPFIPWEMGDPLNTIYVTGDLDIKTNKEFTLDLNGQTIFVEGDIYIDPKVSLDGNGCIIAIGDIDFAPQMATDPDEFIFICSVEGTVFFGPQGDFTGAIAGNVEVQLQPNSGVTWGPPPGDLNFPGGGGGGGLIWGIHTWLYNETYEIP